jgi:hypothetical protein
MVVNELTDKIHRICARMLDETPDSAKWTRYRSELKAAAKELAAQQKEWNMPSQPDIHQDEARQSYRSREKDSADGFAEGMKLFSARKQGSEKKKD